MWVGLRRYALYSSRDLAVILGPFCPSACPAESLVGLPARPARAGASPRSTEPLPNSAFECSFRPGASRPTCGAYSGQSTALAPSTSPRKGPICDFRHFHRGRFGADVHGAPRPRGLYPARLRHPCGTSSSQKKGFGSPRAGTPRAQQGFRIKNLSPNIKSIFRPCFGKRPSGRR
jgi:hypothetical protein